MVEQDIISKLNLEDEILRLKKDLHAIILAHYYQESEIQDIADFVGDSLELARQAKNTEADVIVFAGVHFMAETAKILNPDKLILLPDPEAGCSLAESCSATSFKAFRENHPGYFAITYINCTAQVKALSDIICTSSNAEKIIRQIPEDKPIIFAPDKNLGKYLIKKIGRQMLLWNGSCVVHETFSERKLIELKLEHPDAKIIAHPECEEILLKHADFIGSTSKLLKFVQEDQSDKFIVATESGILHQMKKLAPKKTLISAPTDENCSCNECPYMKLNTMEKLYFCMKNKQPRIEMGSDLIKAALKPIERMLDIT